MNKQILRNTIYIGLFLVPFIPLLVSAFFFFPFITTKAFTWRIIVEIVFAAWLLLALLDARYRPRLSLIFYSILGFLAVIGVANIFGEAPIKSFWSNFERMEGYITLLHLGMFFVVISSVFRNDPASPRHGGASDGASWKRWWNTSLVVSFLIVIYSLLQIFGLLTINQGGVRVDGTLGNAIYLAVYLLFHIFVALFLMWREWKNIALRWIYGLLILAQASILYHTATRGAILGFIGGLIIMAVLNLWNREDKLVRKTSVALLVGLAVLVGGFFAVKDAEFVKDSPVLNRFSSLNAEELKTQGRYFVWPMAFEGVKERPILGWGQENFNYVFQKHYSPEMFRFEPWFDRAHNIFLDWLVAGGILGLLSYLALYGTLLWLIWRPQKSFEGGQGAVFSYTEKSILTGLMATYFFHNFFVFDNLISYVLFFSVLAYVHGRSMEGVPLERSVSANVSTRNIALPLIPILLIFSLYFVNIKPMVTNLTLISALKSLQTPGEMELAIQKFQKAYGGSRLGRPEVAEHIAQNATTILSSDLSTEEKNEFFEFAQEAMFEQLEVLKDDSRYELLTGSFLSTTGQLDEALVYLERARKLIPGKQQVYFEIGAAYINKGEPLKALEVFREAYELAPDSSEAKIIYLVGAIYAGDQETEIQMLNSLTEREVVFDDRIINSYYAARQGAKVVTLLEARKRLDPANADTYQEYIDSLAN